MKIVLASGSPRRIEMMKKHGYDPEIIPAEIDETLPEDIGMRDAVMYLALKKYRGQLRTSCIRDER